MDDVEFTLFTCSKEGEEGHVHSTVADNSADNCWEVDTPYDTAVSGVSGTAGEIVFDYLPAGEYMMAETKTISGYQLPLGQWLLTVDDDGELTIQSRGEAPPAFKKETAENEIIYSLSNYRVIELPSTGGKWKMMITILGMLIIGSTMTYAIIYRKKRL